MSINNRRINETLAESRLKIEIFNSAGRLDQGATDAVSAEIFHPSNVVRVAGSMHVDAAATLVKQAAAAAVVRARLK